MEDPESHKIFNFREYTLKMEENDAPGPGAGLQSALKCKKKQASTFLFLDINKGARLLFTTFTFQGVLTH